MVFVARMIRLEQICIYVNNRKSWSCQMNRVDEYNVNEIWPILKSIVELHSIHLHSSLSRFFTFSKTSKSFPALQFPGYIVKIPCIVQKHLVNENSSARKTGETAFEGEGRVKNDPGYRWLHQKLAAKTVALPGSSFPCLFLLFFFLFFLLFQS